MVCLCQAVGTKLLHCLQLFVVSGKSLGAEGQTMGQIGTKLGKPDDDRHVSFGTAQEAGASAELPVPEQHVSGPCIASLSCLSLWAAPRHLHPPLTQPPPGAHTVDMNWKALVPCPSSSIAQEDKGCGRQERTESLRKGQHNYPNFLVWAEGRLRLWATKGHLVRDPKLSCTQKRSLPPGASSRDLPLTQATKQAPFLHLAMALTMIYPLPVCCHGSHHDPPSS